MSTQAFCVCLVPCLRMFLMVLNYFATIYIGPPPTAFYLMRCARVVQGERKVKLACFSEPQPTLAEHFPNALQRYKIFLTFPNILPTFFKIFRIFLSNLHHATFS